MRRRAYLAVAVTGLLAGCSNPLEQEDSYDADGDGVTNKEDYAPWDGDVQSKSDVTGGDGTTDSDGDGVLDDQDYAPGDPDVQEKSDLTDPAEIHSAGVLEIEQTFPGDLDTGREQSDGADFWFEAETHTERYLSPMGNAVFAVGDSQPSGRVGCEAATLTSDRIPTDRLQGRYVCAKTNEGRYAELYVDEVTPSPGVMRIAYTTWRA